MGFIAMHGLNAAHRPVCKVMEVYMRKTRANSIIKSQDNIYYGYWENIATSSMTDAIITSQNNSILSETRFHCSHM